MATSSKLVINGGQEDLVSTVNSTVMLLSGLKEAFDLTSIQGYPREDILDTISSSDLAPKLHIYSSNEKLKKLVRDEGKSTSDLLDSALSRVKDE